MSTASVLRRQVGRELETIREDAGILVTDREASEIVGSSRTLKRLEQGVRVRLTFPVIGALCDYYGVSPQKKFELQRMWRLVDETNWTQPSHAVMASGFDAYLEFERFATGFDLHSTLWVPGPLQTENYMRQRFEEDPTTPDAEIQELVHQRLERQEMFRSREPAPTVRVLLNETVLRCGCDEEQLDRLLEEDSKRNVTIKYLDFRDGLPHQLDVPFNVLSFSDSADPSLVYLESPYERRFYEQRSVVHHYLQVLGSGFERSRSLREYNHEPSRMAEVEQE